MCAGRWAAAGVAVVAVATCCLIGCDRRADVPPAPVPATQPATTQTAATRPTTVQAVTRPAASVIRIDGKPYEFARAQLRIKQGESGLRATLHSDDPKEAIRDDYTGNTYYLEMPLEIDDVKDLPTVGWRFSTSTIERAESAFNGIFLNGARQRLQPKDVTVDFGTASADDAVVVVHLRGQFVLFDRDEDDSTARTVLVEADLAAEPERK